MSDCKKKRVIVWDGKNQANDNAKTGLFQPRLYHALIIIFLEFFSWGLLMIPIITVLNETFGNYALLMNGLVQGVKGMLSFLCAPLVGALSDVWGRKPFLLLTVSFTCAPLPLMKISPMWYFAITSLSGVMAVTFSIVFAYVADITTKEERSTAYGLVSATFAASMVTSPAIGAYLGSLYGDGLVVALATAVAVLDVFFIMVAVPESLSEIRHPEAYHLHLSHVSWEKADPFGSLKKIGKEKLILLLSVTVFLSYLPESGEYASFFVYLRLVMGFRSEEVSAFVAMVGVLSVVAQTILLLFLMKYFGNKITLIVGLLFEMAQLFMIGFGLSHWLLWTAGAVAAIGSITYPAISVFVSEHASPDQQGVAQGVITGVRSLCNGLGPAFFGFIFYLFHVDLNEHSDDVSFNNISINETEAAFTRFPWHAQKLLIPGPPFVAGGVMVILAMVVAAFIPSTSPCRTDIIADPLLHLDRPTISANLLEMMVPEDESLIATIASSEEECS